MPVGGARPGAGRPKGSIGKRTADISAKLARLGCDPIEGMARIAMDDGNEVGLRAKMFAELAQYIAPKRKAIEVGGPGMTPLAPRFDAEDAKA